MPAASELTSSAAQRRAADISLKIKGQKQGDFNGNSKKKGREKLIDLYSVEVKTESPIDLASGQTTGRRKHGPVIVLGEVEKTLPMMYTALVTNETLATFKLDFYRSNPDGKQAIFYTIELANSRLIDVEMFTDEDGRPNFKAEFAYQQITWTFADGNITATDSWQGVT